MRFLPNTTWRRVIAPHRTSASKVRYGMVPVPTPYGTGTVRYRYCPYINIKHITYNYRYGTVPYRTYLKCTVVQRRRTVQVPYGTCTVPVRYMYRTHTVPHHTVPYLYGNVKDFEILRYTITYFCIFLYIFTIWMSFVQNFKKHLCL